MARLPTHIADALTALAAPTSTASDLTLALSAILEAERGFDSLSRSLEAFREASRALGLLEEARIGQKVYDAWARIVRFYLSPLLGGQHLLARRLDDSPEAPRGREALAARWERLIPEVESFIQEERAIEKDIAESSTAMLVSFRLRSRLRVLDHRAARIKVGVDLLRSDLSLLMRQLVQRQATSLGCRLPRGLGDESSIHEPRIDS